MDLEELKILRLRVMECQRREEVNHPQRCREHAIAYMEAFKKYKSQGKQQYGALSTLKLMIFFLLSFRLETVALNWLHLLCIQACNMCTNLVYCMFMSIQHNLQSMHNYSPEHTVLTVI